MAAVVTFLEGFGEAIRAHRVYMGLSQRELAVLLSRDRRAYQRVETGDTNCPVELWAQIESLVDTFDEQVETVLNEARRLGGVELAVQHGTASAWERNVAGRAAVLAHVETNGPKITLAVTGPSERSE